MKRPYFNEWETYILGGLGVIVGAIATAGVAEFSSWCDGKSINWTHLWFLMVSTALLTGFAYASKHPIPMPDLTVSGPASLEVPAGTTAAVTTTATVSNPSSTSIDKTKPISSLKQP